MIGSHNFSLFWWLGTASLLWLGTVQPTAKPRLFGLSAPGSPRRLGKAQWAVFGGNEGWGVHFLVRADPVLACKPRGSTSSFFANNTETADRTTVVLFALSFAVPRLLCVSSTQRRVLVSRTTDTTTTNQTTYLNPQRSSARHNENQHPRVAKKNGLYHRRSNIRPPSNTSQARCGRISSLMRKRSQRTSWSSTPFKSSSVLCHGPLQLPFSGTTSLGSWATMAGRSEWYDIPYSPTSCLIYVH